MRVVVATKEELLTGTCAFPATLRPLLPLIAVLQKRYFMMCNDWFKGASERKLEPGKVPENGICTYRVVVTTSDMRGAGTDADVTMQVRTCAGAINVARV